MSADRRLSSGKQIESDDVVVGLEEVIDVTRQKATFRYGRCISDSIPGGMEGGSSCVCSRRIRAPDDANM